MAPEMISGKVYDSKVDIWSFGVIVYMLLTGRNPFPGKDKNTIRKLIKTKQLDFTKDYFSNISSQAIDFIKKTLDRNPETRWSAQKLLNHPWILEMDKLTQEPLERDRQVEIFSNLRNFSKASKFQKTVLSIILGLKQDRDDLKDFKRVFDDLDLDKDGTISLEEVQAYEEKMKDLNLKGKWKDILKKCDLDGDGKVDFQEFITAATNH